MKKHILLSVAAATALTFGATNDAKAETIQPATLNVQNISNYQLPIQHMNQANLNSFLPSMFSYVKWTPVTMQKNNCIMPWYVFYSMPCGDVIVKDPCDQNEITKPDENPADGNETTKPDENPADGNETTKPDENPADGNETTKPDENPADGNETTKPDENPADGNEITKPDEKPIDGNEITKPDEKPADGNEITKPDEKPIDGNEITKPDEKPADGNEITKPDEDQPTEDVDSSLSAFEQQVVDLTNDERAKQGLPALQVDPQLSKVARIKSEDMQKNGYFDHNSPTYGSPFDMMKQFGISYKSAGENIAQGQRTPEEVVRAWMNSPGHRANILNSDYTHIGVGYVEDGNYWTQQFISK